MSNTPSIQSYKNALIKYEVLFNYRTIDSTKQLIPLVELLAAASPSLNTFVFNHNQNIPTDDDIQYAFLRILDIVFSYELFIYSTPTILPLKQSLKTIKLDLDKLKWSVSQLQTQLKIQFNKSQTEGYKTLKTQYKTKLAEYNAKLNEYKQYLSVYFNVILSTYASNVQKLCENHKIIFSQIVKDFIVVHTSTQYPMKKELVHKLTTLYELYEIKKLEVYQTQPSIIETIDYPDIFTKIRLFSEYLDSADELFIKDINDVCVKQKSQSLQKQPRGGKRRIKSHTNRKLAIKSRHPRKSRHKRRTKKTT
jgi:hypothetical protein